MSFASSGPSFLAVLLNTVLSAIPGWQVLARRSWCREQKGRLLALEPKIVWIHDGEKVPWALWGADNGFFVVEWAGRMPYLTPAAAQG